MTVREIIIQGANMDEYNSVFDDAVREFLECSDYDGLFYPGECACTVDDLAPCGNMNPDCIPGYRVEYPDGGCSCGQGCYWHIEAKRHEEEGDMP